MRRLLIIREPFISRVAREREWLSCKGNAVKDNEIADHSEDMRTKVLKSELIQIERIRRKITEREELCG